MSNLSDYLQKELKSLSDVDSNLAPQKNDVLTYDSVNGWSAKTSKADRIKITQNSHGFNVLDVLRISGGTWVKAQADDFDTMGLLTVVEVIDINNFIVAQIGLINVSGHGLTIDKYYYLSDVTAGSLIDTEPNHSQPILYVISNSKILLLDARAIKDQNKLNETMSFKMILALT